uniref:Uncharacterized protein n=1 Tax=Cannabis sativa TaxID=3483 RepID=A0A803QEY9_CANSA
MQKFIQRMMDVAAETKVTDNVKMMALTSGLATESLLWGDLQRKKADTLTDFLIRAQGFINLEEAYTQAYGVLPASSTDVTNAQTTQMTTPSIYHHQLPSQLLRFMDQVLPCSHLHKLLFSGSELNKPDTVPLLDKQTKK